MKAGKIIALLLCAALLCSFTACFNVKVNFPEVPERSTSAPATEMPATLPPESTSAVPATLPPESTAAPVESTAAPAESTAAPVESTAAPAESTAAPVESTAAPVTLPPETTAAPVTEPPTEAPKTPDMMSADELLAYYNETLNRVKSENLGFNKSKLTSILDLQLSNSAANTLVGFVKGMLLKDTADETSVAKGQSGKDVFSPPGKDYVSILKPEDVTNVKCEKSGNNYVITVNVVGETNPAEGSAMSRGFDFMTVDDVMNIYAPKVGATVARENVEVVFSDCYGVLTVGANGQIQSFRTYVKGVMNMKDASVKKVVTINTDLAVTLASTTDYTNFQY